MINKYSSGREKQKFAVHRSILQGVYAQGEVSAGDRSSDVGWVRGGVYEEVTNLSGILNDSRVFSAMLLMSDTDESFKHFSFQL